MRLVAAVTYLSIIGRSGALDSNEPLIFGEAIGFDGNIRRLEQFDGALRNERPRDFAYLASERDELDPLVIDYGGNHPFERQKLQRRAEENDDIYEPLRIKFLTEPIENLLGTDGATDEKVNSIINDVLPEVADRWSQHLSVAPTVGNIEMKKKVCFGMFDTTLPESVFENGVEDADVAILVSGMDSLSTASGRTLAVCSTGILAVALSCQLDQFDRPVVGFINFCIDNWKRRMTSHPVSNANVLRTRKDGLYNQNTGTGLVDAPVLVATHEVGHILGMDVDLFKYYRDSDTGLPLTPRPFQKKQVTCVDGAQKNIVFPADNTIKIEVDNRGRVHHHVVTPRVRTIARNHFNCQTMIGARLENQPTAVNSCSGSHWDEKHYFSEIMGPIFSGLTDVLSPLTLGLMDDTGWYKVSYENSQLAPYGHGLGCDFVNEDCIIDEKVPDFAKDVFCDVPTVFNEDGQFVSSTEVVCDPTHVSFSVCDLYDVTAAPSNVGPFDPNAVKYFSNTDLSSTFSRADFCPLPITALFGGDCRNPDSTDRGFYGSLDSFGSGSRCINGLQNSFNGQRKRPACLPVECDAVNRVVIINGQVCQEDGQFITFPDVPGGSFECPRLTTVCPQLFCPAGCSGRGVCDYEATPPACICDNPADVSPSCAGVIGPTFAPSSRPSTSSLPSLTPSNEPSLSSMPSESQIPSAAPIHQPTSEPSESPSFAPSSSPNPSSAPTGAPSGLPTTSMKPSASPTKTPTIEPTISTAPSAMPVAFTPTAMELRIGGPSSSSPGKRYTFWFFASATIIAMIALLP